VTAPGPARADGGHRPVTCPPSARPNRRAVSAARRGRPCRHERAAGARPARRAARPRRRPPPANRRAAARVRQGALPGGAAQGERGPRGSGCRRLSAGGARAPQGGWAAPVPRGGTAGGSAPGGSVGPREAPGRAALGPPCGPAGVRPVPGRVGVPRAAQLCAAPVSGAESSRWDGRRCAGGVTARRRQGLWARCCVRDGRFSPRSGGAPNRADGFP